MRIFRPEQCRTVTKVREAMRDALLCDVRREAFAVESFPRLCGDCREEFLSPHWPEELRAIA